MGSVYTERFFRAPSVTGGPFTVFTCPAGIRAVVKTITIVWGDTALSGLDAWVQEDDLTKLARITLATGLTPMTIGGSQLWYGTMALEPGDSLAVQTASGTADFHASGYLLTLP
jgi:hypothetical protein